MVRRPAAVLPFGEQLRASIRQMSLLASTLRVGKGSNVYICGDHEDSVYLIESGQIKILALSPDAKECLLAIYTDGDLFGELSLTGVSRVETATAMKDSVLKKISCDSFLSRVMQDGLHQAFIEYLVLRIAEQQQIIRNLVTGDSEHRLAATLLQLAQKLGKQDRCSLRIEKRISHQELSEMVGTTRSRVGHFLQKFRHLGLIETAPPAFLIVHPVSLKAYLEADIHAGTSHPEKASHSAHY